MAGGRDARGWRHEQRHRDRRAAAGLWPAAGDLRGRARALPRVGRAASCSAEAVPHTERWEETGLVDREFWRKAGAAGPESASRRPRSWAAPASTTSASTPSSTRSRPTPAPSATTSASPTTSSSPYLLELTNDEQRQRWLPALTRGELIPAIAMTEPGAGSDLRGIAANGGLAGRPLPPLRLQDLRHQRHPGRPGDRRRPGRAGGRSRASACSRSKPGPRASAAAASWTRSAASAQDTAELFFDDVVVAARERARRAGRGAAHLMRNLAQERLSIAIVGRRRRRAGAGDHPRVRARPAGVRQADRHLPGQPLRPRRAAPPRSRSAASTSTAASPPTSTGELGAAEAAARSCGPPSCRAGSSTAACSCTAATATWTSTRSPPLARLARHPHLRRHQRDHEGDRRPRPLALSGGTRKRGRA